MRINTSLIRDLCKTFPSAQCRRQAQILVFKILKVFSGLIPVRAGSFYSILNKIERSAKATILGALVFPLCLYGCARAPKAFPTGPAPDVNQILESLKKCKNELKTFGGVGRFKTVRGTSVKSLRMVWIGSRPQNLRAEILGPWGQPALSFVMNGSSLFLHSRQDDRYFKGDATIDNLSRLVSVPVRAEDLFGLLSGQPPILPFHHAKIRASTAEGGWLLSLHKKWGRLIEKIWLKDDAKAVEQVEVFDSWGNAQYRVAFSEFHEVESLFLPHRIAISNTDGSLWSLTVEKYQTKISIPDGAFTLDVSGAQMMDLNS